MNTQEIVKICKNIYADYVGMGREKAKAIHNAYCDYEIAEAKSPSRIYSVRAEIKTKSGVKTHNMSKAMLLGRILSYRR